MAALFQGERDLFEAGDFNLVHTKLGTVVDAADRTDGGGSTLSSTG